MSRRLDTGPMLLLAHKTCECHTMPMPMPTPLHPRTISTLLSATVVVLVALEKYFLPEAFHASFDVIPMLLSHLKSNGTR